MRHPPSGYGLSSVSPLFDLVSEILGQLQEDAEAVPGWRFPSWSILVRYTFNKIKEL
jgi:hypothetical protein